MSDHSFNPLIAQKYGINEAILINSFIFWTRTNYANSKNFHEGRYWVYGTPEFFQKYFPYFTPRQIQYAIRTLVGKGVLLKNRFNKKGYDRTNWYSLSDAILFELNLDRTCLQPAPRLIGQNCLMHRTNLSDQYQLLNTSTKHNEVIDLIPPYIPPLETQTTDSNEKPDSPITATSAYKNKKRALTKIPAVVESASHEMIGDDMINLNFEYKDTLYNPVNHANLPVVARTTTNPPTPTGSNLPSTKIASKELALISQENHFEIEQDALESWLEIRKRKRAPVTPRVWKLLSKELEKFDNPHEAFDIMIMNGWSTIRYDWVKRQASGSVGGYDHTDTSWANKKDIFD